MNLECEVMFVVDGERFAELLRRKPFRVSPEYPAPFAYRQTRLYFDTAKRELLTRGDSLCLRRGRDGGPSFLWKKLVRHDPASGLLVKQEVDRPFERDLGDALLKELESQLFIKAPLEPVLLLDSERTQHLCRYAEPRLYASFDEITVRSLAGAQLGKHWAIELEQTRELEDLSPSEDFMALVAHFTQALGLAEHVAFPSKYHLGRADADAGT